MNKEKAIRATPTNVGGYLRMWSRGVE